MKEFNLEEYLTHPERRVVTRDGRPVRIICTDRKSNISYDGPILALVEDIKEGREYCCSYSSNGKVYESESDVDLFFVPTKHDGWINVYRNKLGTEYGKLIYDSEESAKFGKNNENYLTTIKIEWED